MTLPDARQLRDEIREYGLHCIVPLGFRPDRYFARIFTWDEAAQATVPKEFTSRREWLAYRKVCDRKRLQDQEWIESMEARYGSDWLQHLTHRRPKPRSSIEIMIDRACGLE